MNVQAKLLCAVALSGFAALAAASSAQAVTMQECSAKYKAAKADGSLNGQKWNDFRKAQCAADATAAPAALKEKVALARVLGQQLIVVALRKLERGNGRLLQRRCRSDGEEVVHGDDRAPPRL